MTRNEKYAARAADQEARRLLAQEVKESWDLIAIIGIVAGFAAGIVLVWKSF